MAIGRNDPCPCGSGKTYKECCLSKSQVISLQAAREGQAHRNALDKLYRELMDAGNSAEFEEALVRFTADPEQDPDLEADELLAALDWIAFAYRSPADGATFCRRFAATTGDLTAEERSLLDAWAGAEPGFFTVTGVAIDSLDLVRLMDDRPFTVTVSGTGLKPGDFISAWLLPQPSGWRFGFKREQLPPEGSGPLRHLLGVELEILLRQQPEAGWDDLYRQCWPRLLDSIALAGVDGTAVLGIQAPPGPAVAPAGAGDPAYDPGWSNVLDLLLRQLKNSGAYPERCFGAERLIRDVSLTLAPRSARPQGWAAGLYYLVQGHIHGEEISQVDAGELFGVSGTVTGARAREVVEALSVEPLDARYADLLDPYIRGVWRIICLRAVGEEVPTEAEVAASSASDASQLDRRRHMLEQALREQKGELSGPAGQAQELIDQAWEASGARRARLAREALQAWPDAADAYVILAGESERRGDNRAASGLYEEGVKAGRRALGPRTLREESGHLWGLVEARPYMRARAGLAMCLWNMGEREAAIAHGLELLRLNFNDNQGMRYVLARWLLELGDDARLGKLLGEYPDDAMASLLFTRAVWQFRVSGPGEQANQLLQTALETNPHVAAYLLGKRPLPKVLPEYIGWRDESEAAVYAAEFGDGWRHTPGALAWLRSRAGL